MIHLFDNDGQTFEIDTERYEIRRDGEALHAEPQVFGVLVHLLLQRGRMVPKSELFDEVWGDQFVSESALTSRIKTARQLVGDNGRSQRVIRTVHGRGYQFIARVSTIDVDAADAGGTQTTGGARHRPAAVNLAARHADGPRPSGTVTFLFSDIEGSSQLWEEHAAEMAASIARHDRLVRDSITRHDGVIFATAGDGMAAAFQRADDALVAARSIRHAIGAETWPEPIDLRVRLGLHTGVAVERDGDYFGPTVNRAARITAAAHGGQTLVSDTTAALVADGSQLRDLGTCRIDRAMPAIRLWQPEEASFPALVGATGPELPQLRTELIGREAEVDQLTQAIGHHRLVSVVGPGGAGKTTLALAIAHRTQPDFPSGTVFAELASAEPGSVHRSVAEAAGVEGASASGAAELARHLARRPTLIVLDNCEHLLDECADFVDLVLDAGSVATVLVTSREPLGVDGERVTRLGSLSHAAPQLFAARASAVAPELELTADDPLVIDVCERLDGLPLAVELAAAQLAHLGLDELSSRLTERLALTSTGRSRGRERHLTLERTIAWSYDLLDDGGRRLLRQFGVFPGSFDLPAAEAIGRSDEWPDTITVLADLVAKSLVIRNVRTGRYRLLETVRAFASRRLLDADELSDAEERLRTHIVERATRLPRLDRWFSGSNATAMRSDLANARFAIEMSLRTGRPTDALEIVVASTYLFRNTMNCIDGRAWTARLGTFAEQLDVDDRLWLAFVEADVAQGTADHRAGRVAASRAVELAGGVDDAAVRAIARHLEALHHVVSEPHTARARLDSALEAARFCDDPRLQQLVRSFIAMAALSAGDVVEGTRLAEEVALEVDGDGYEVFIANWAAWTAGLIGDDPARVRRWIERQGRHLARFGMAQPWMFDWSAGIVAAMDGQDGSDALDRAQEQAEAEGHDIDADIVLARAVGERLAGRPVAAAELLACAMSGRLGNASHYIVARTLRSQLRDALGHDGFASATSRADDAETDHGEGPTTPIGARASDRALA